MKFLLACDIFDPAQLLTSVVSNVTFKALQAILNEGNPEKHTDGKIELIIIILQIIDEFSNISEWFCKLYHRGCYHSYRDKNMC